MDSSTTSQNKVSEHLESTAKELLKQLSTVNQDTFNEVPSDDGWTIGQVARHLLISYTGVLEMLYGPVEKTQRDPQEKAGMIKKDFLDFTVKMESPEFVIPESRDYDKEALITSLSVVMQKIAEASEKLDLTATCTAFSFPGYGDLTRAELSYFVVYHTQRHIHQIKKIQDKL